MAKRVHQSFTLGFALNSHTAQRAADAMRNKTGVQFTWEHTHGCTIFTPARNLGELKWSQANCIVEGLRIALTF